MSKINLHPDRYFDPQPEVRRIARELYDHVRGLPLVCPHGHVEPRLLAEDVPFPDPASLLLIPDHYIFRMLYSRGISLESLGIPTVDGTAVEQDSRKIWRIFCAHYYLFAATPTGCWLEHVLAAVLDIDEKPSARNADTLYDAILEKLARPAFRPRALYEQFNIEVLSTTDAASDSLEYHRALSDSSFKGRVIPTFRPDGVTDIAARAWPEEMDRLRAASGLAIHSYREFIAALEKRRAFFREMGATATDHGVNTPFTHRLSGQEAETIFQKALKGQVDANDARLFTAHMLMEMARMSVDDGLVMQIHPGAWRNHNRFIHERFGADKGADIPVHTEFTGNLRPLLEAYGNDPNFRLIVFTLDESTYARELAPLAGHYPAMRLGPPWWFHDSIHGMIRYRERVTETAGFYNTVGFNDDTRAFLSIPARHDLNRRVDANFLAGLVSRHILDMEQAREIARALAYDLARDGYKL